MISNRFLWVSFGRLDVEWRFCLSWRDSQFNRLKDWFRFSFFPFLFPFSVTHCWSANHPTTIRNWYQFTSRIYTFLFTQSIYSLTLPTLEYDGAIENPHKKINTFFYGRALNKKEILLSLKLSNEDFWEKTRSRPIASEINIRKWSWISHGLQRGATFIWVTLN